jgi:hypothetical protein
MRRSRPKKMADRYGEVYAETMCLIMTESALRRPAFMASLGPSSARLETFTTPDSLRYDRPGFGRNVKIAEKTESYNPRGRPPAR